MAGKPARSGPPGNQNGLQHGLYSLFALRKQGKRDMRKAFWREFKKAEEKYAIALAGDPSPQEMTLITDLVWHDYYIAIIDIEICSRRRLVRKGKPYALLELRPRYSANRREIIKIVGTKRRAKDLPDLARELARLPEQGEKLEGHAEGDRESCKR